MSSVKSANSTSNSPSLDLGHLDEGEYDANLEASPSSDEKENEGEDTRAFALEIARINGLNEETTNLLSDQELEIVH